MAIDFILNKNQTRIEGAADTPLLWALRDEKGLTGTKFGCGAGLCGACTVLIDGQAFRSCQTAVFEVAGKSVVTIDDVDGPVAKAVMNAWITAQAPQCGYCQPGFVMATIGAITAKPDAKADEILGGLTNICRCGAYDAIRSAVNLALASLATDGKSSGGAVR